MKNKYIINVNGGVFDKNGKNVFSREELDEVFEEWSEKKEMVDEEGERVSVDDLIEFGDFGGVVRVSNKEMVEYGGSYVEVSVVELGE